MSDPIERFGFGVLRWDAFVDLVRRHHESYALLYGVIHNYRDLSTPAPLLRVRFTEGFEGVVCAQRFRRSECDIGDAVVMCVEGQRCKMDVTLFIAAIARFADIEAVIDTRDFDPDRLRKVCHPALQSIPERAPA